MDLDLNSSVQPDSFKYRLLTDRTKDFRLACLDAATDHSPDLHCEIDHASLDATPEYEALSYVWGTEQASKPIYIRHAHRDASSSSSTVASESFRFWPTANLEAALRALRLPDKPRRLWIDSLCIDQSNLQERADQVRLMGRIYGTSTRDLLWLDADPAMTSMAMAVMHRLAKDESDRQVLHDLTKEEWHALKMTFGTNPVWHRVWIVQELYFALRIQLVCHGDALDWSIIDKVFDNDPGLMEIPLYQQHTLLHNRWLHCFENLSRIHALRRETTRKNRLLTRRVMTIATIFSHVDATIPHDRIYGLINLAQDAEGLPIDYTLSLDEFSVAFSKHVLKSRHPMPALSAALGDPLRGFHDLVGHTSHRALPSWVVDLSKRVPSATGLTFSGGTIFNACGFMTDTVAVFSPDNTIFSTAGWIVDKVKAISPPYALSQDKNPNERWVQSVRSWGADISSSKHYTHSSTWESELDAFWRTITTDRVGDERISAYNSSLPLDSRVVPRQLPWLSDWRFSTTDRGIFCMLPPAAESGDLIVVLLGSNIPYLLRPLGPFRDGMREVDCRLAGEAYVHGYMDGESCPKKAKGFMEVGGFEHPFASFVMQDLLLRIHIH